MRLKPAGSFVDVMKDASSARESPAAKCVLPFCVGIPTRSTCERWYGKNTNRPRYNASALDAEMTTFTSSNARALTRAPRFADRVCFATRLRHTRTEPARTVSHSPAAPARDRSRPAIARSPPPRSPIHRAVVVPPRHPSRPRRRPRAPLQRHRRRARGNGRAREHRARIRDRDVARDTRRARIRSRARGGVSTSHDSRMHRTPRARSRPDCLPTRIRDRAAGDRARDRARLFTHGSTRSRDCLPTRVRDRVRAGRDARVVTPFRAHGARAVVAR